jgi:phage-related protein
MLKSPFNFSVKKNDGSIYDMQEIGVWVSYFHIYSPNVVLEKITVPGMPGSLVSDAREDERKIAIELQLEADSILEFDELKHKIFNIFFTKEKLTIIRDMYPNQEIYAYLEGEYDFDNITDMDGNVPLTLTMPTPYKYGQEKEVTFESSASFDVEGTVETEPVIEVTLNGDTEYVAVSNGTDINMVGFPAKQEEIVTEWQTPIFITSGQTLTGWTTSAEPSLGGVPLGGELKANGDRFYADDYGYNPHQWHGPAMKTSLSEPIQDFQFDVGFRMRKTGNNQCGAIRISLLDASSVSVCNIEMTKHYGGVDTLYPQVLARGNVVLPESQGQVNSYFGGVIRVFRQGNRFTAFMWQIRDGDGVWVKLAETNWLDTSNVAAAKVTQVQIRLLQRADFPVCEQWIDDIQVYRLNDLNTNQVPIIGKAGDEIVFDHRNDNILKNGESIIDEKAFIGNYFKLQPGRNSIALEPANKIQSVKVRYRPKWR